MGGCCSAEAIDADEALATLQAEAPELVIDGEDFLFAFAFMRDQVYFTNLRILKAQRPRPLEYRSLLAAQLHAAVLRLLEHGDLAPERLARGKKFSKRRLPRQWR